MPCENKSESSRKRTGPSPREVGNFCAPSILDLLSLFLLLGVPRSTRVFMLLVPVVHLELTTVSFNLSGDSKVSILPLT